PNSFLESDFFSALIKWASEVFCLLFEFLGGEIYLAVSWYTFVYFIFHIHLISHFCVPHLKFLEPKWSHIIPVFQTPMTYA
ncbi:hypothetical protein, partial [Faecalimonas umbilicata]|uniref:hypothetical protein n=1 Tax=Faecalimonas umbilicata TaxID=1912855 RepID=UPI0022E69902